MTQKEILFKAMIKAIEESNEKELQFIIAKREKDAAIAAYKEFEKVESCQNLTEEPVGEGAKLSIF